MDIVLLLETNIFNVRFQFLFYTLCVGKYLKQVTCSLAIRVIVKARAFAFVTSEHIRHP